MNNIDKLRQQSFYRVIDILSKHVNELKRQLKESNKTILQLRSDLAKSKRDENYSTKGKWVELKNEER